jgi:hypothetical protein
VADLPENDLKDVLKNRLGTGPLFLQVKIRLKRRFQENTPVNEDFSPALTSETADQIPASSF